jgi:hypothetical protein
MLLDTACHEAVKLVLTNYESFFGSKIRLVKCTNVQDYFGEDLYKLRSLSRNVGYDILCYAISDNTFFYALYHFLLNDLSLFMNYGE